MNNMIVISTVLCFIIISISMTLSTKENGYSSVKGLRVKAKQYKKVSERYINYKR